MSPTTGLIVFIAAIVLSVLIGTKLKINIGFVALCFAFIIGVPMAGLSAPAVAKLFPANIFITQLVATFFYGFASLNGSFNGIANRLIYKTRKATWAMPFVVFLATFVISMLGAGADATPVIMSPIAFMLATQAGYDPLLASMAVWAGSVCTIGASWTAGGATAYSIWANSLGNDMTSVLFQQILVLLFITLLVAMVIVYLVKGTHKRVKDVTVEAPQPFTKAQIKTLAVVGLALVALLLPNILKTLVPSLEGAKWFASKIGIQIICLVGAMLMQGLGLADAKEVFRSKVPWNSIIMIAGMATLVALAGELGIVDQIGAWVGESVSARWMPFMLVLIGGLLSYVAAATSVIYPLFAPLIPVLSAASGASVTSLAIALMAGANCSSFSPVSTGGSMALLGASDEVRDKVIGRQFRMAVYILIGFLILAALGVFGLF